MSETAPQDTAGLATAKTFLETVRVRVDERIQAYLPPQEGPLAMLGEAMAYSVMAGGKRLRPALAMATCRAVGGDDEATLPFGCALELIHTYSLIHDDLPAMDDDDLRRGKPTSHKVFGEAMAVLAGDALHTLAFEILLTGLEPPEIARRVGYELAHAAGPGGMVGGQVEDLAAAGRDPDEAMLMRVQRGKTAALFEASCRGGAWIGGAEEATVDATGAYALHLGYAFQMVDDVLDVTGTAETLGKTPGKDAADDRMTWVTLEGVDATMDRARGEVAQAIDAVRDLPGRDLLAGLAHFVTRRDR